MQSPYLEVLTGESTYEPKPEICTFPFPCDSFQRHAFESIEKGNNLIVTVPTSSGKTVVAKYAIMNTILKGKRVVYTSPVKSLSNEKYNEFKAELPTSIGLLTGDNKIDPDSNCLIVTTEILKESLYQLRQKVETPDREISQDFVSSIGCVILDEIQYMSDPDRGLVWEETIILLGRDVQIIMLSATIRNTEEFASWIGNIKEKTISWIPATKRIVPLVHYMYVDKLKSTETMAGHDSMILPIIDASGNYKDTAFHNARKLCSVIKQIREKKHKGTDFNMICRLVTLLKENDMLQTIFFAFSKLMCEKYAAMVNDDTLMTVGETHQVEKIWNHHMAPYFKKYEKTLQYYTVKKLALKGVGYHHSGLIPILKEIIEILFKAGLIKVLFATETFAVGVNMPARSVVFTDIVKPTNKGKRLLNTAEFRQMAGRAGRRGLDTMGHVILLPLYDYPGEEDFRQVALGLIPCIISQFKWSYQFFLKIHQSNAIDVATFFKHSLSNLNRLAQTKDLTSKSLLLIPAINDLETQIESYDRGVVDKVTTFVGLEKIQMGNETLGKFKIGLSKKQLKDIQTLKSYVSKNDSAKTLLPLVKTLIQTKEEHAQILKQIDAYDTCINNSIKDISELLEFWGYITPDGPTIRGIIASQINACNAILLTEMIMNDYFVGLTASEIVGLISIFTDSKEKQATIDFIGTPELYKRLTDTKKLAEECIDDESRIINNVDIVTNWSISTDYIDLAYKWCSGADIGEIILMLNALEEYEGNFVKNMLKIVNICRDVQAICKMVGKIEVLPVFETIDELVLRDIVSINSIYLGI
jgi:superfamily II RNA helicase